MLGAVRKNVARRTTHSENEAFRARGAVIRPQSLSSGVLFSGSFDNTLEWNLSFGTLPLFRDSFIQGTHDLVPEKLLWLIFTWLTKLQTTKLLILQRFYFHDVLEQLKTNFHTNFLFKRVLGFVIEEVWTSKILRDTAFTWRQCLWASFRNLGLTSIQGIP